MPFFIATVLPKMNICKIVLQFKKIYSGNVSAKWDTGFKIGVEKVIPPVKIKPFCLLTKENPYFRKFTKKK